MSIHRTASVTLGAMAAMAGLVSLVGYAIPSLVDFSDPNVGHATAIVGIAIIWSITLGAFIMAFRLLRPFKKSDRPNRGA
jgi:hypothetical protein